MCGVKLAVVSSVLGHFGVILDDTLAEAHGEDHPEELEEMKEMKVSALLSETRLTGEELTQTHS